LSAFLKVVKKIIKNLGKKYANRFFCGKTVFRALSSQVENCKSFYTKVFPLFKNGQKKCPKTKTQNTFAQNLLCF